MTPSPPIARFGEFTLNMGTRQLLQQGTEVHLSPKAFDLLAMLVTDRPRALSKGDLLSRLWPDAFVTEGNLFSLVKEIRRALEDDPRRPRFIRTLHRFGYAFAADASTLSPTPASTASATCWLVGESQIRLSEGPQVLGRDSDADVWFDRPGVSRRHARIVVTGREAMLEDLGSRNGTWLRGTRITERTLVRDGDELRLGSVKLTFRVRGLEDSTEAI
jgi:DNA-binding winged helix-turn-helix (wHTH) protein